MRHQVPDGVVNGQTVGDVAAGAIDVDRNRPRVVVGEFPETLDDRPRRVFLDVADEVDIPEAVRLLFSDDLFHRLYQFREYLVVDFAHLRRTSHASCRRRTDELSPDHWPARGFFVKTPTYRRLL